MQTELVISIFTFVAVASGFYFTTKSRLDKIEKDLLKHNNTNTEIFALDGSKFNNLVFL